MQFTGPMTVIGVLTTIGAGVYVLYYHARPAREALRAALGSGLTGARPGRRLGHLP